MTDHDVKIVVFTGFLSVVPARAGVIPAPRKTRPSGSCGPRASGGDPYGVCGDWYIFSVVPARAGVIPLERHP